MPVLLDGAQAAPHMTVDVQALDCDFYAFSGHKMCGPTGIGVLWARRSILEDMPPFLGGGSMIQDVRLDGFVPTGIPHRFEAGTPPIAEIIGLGEAIAFLNEVGMEAVQAHEQAMSAYAFRTLTERFGERMVIHGPAEPDQRAGVMSFALGDVHPHDVSQILDEHGVAVRAGHHCAKPLMKALGDPGQHPEGRFLPETYAWVKGDSDLDGLRRAHAALQEALDEAWAARADGLPLKNADEALALASIVEKETGIAEERQAIAGVFVRRLKIGMRLQTDPTVIYGMGAAYAGNIRRSDLTTDTPYNTYTRAGLTPTPIAMPGKAALRAATQPANGDALYFVAVGDGSGRHVFSASLDAHNAAVRDYVQRYRAQREAAPK